VGGRLDRHARDLTRDVDHVAVRLELLVEPAHRLAIGFLDGAEGELHVERVLEEIMAAARRGHRHAASAHREACRPATMAGDLGGYRTVAGAEPTGHEKNETP
jgi:hypothetical protein